MRNVNIKKLTFLLLILISNTCFAVTFTSGAGLVPNVNDFPNNPSDIVNDDVDIISGTMASLGGNYTMSYINNNSGSQNFNVTVEAGATMSYLGADTSGNTLIMEDTEYGTPLYIYGTISKGNAFFGNAVKLQGINSISVNLTGSILGAVDTTALNDCSFEIDGAAAVITEAIKGAGNGNQTIAFGLTTPVNFTAPAISGFATMQLHAGTITMQNAVTNITNFTMDNGTSLIMDSSSSMSGITNMSLNTNTNLTMQAGTSISGGAFNSTPSTALAFAMNSAYQLPLISMTAASSLNGPITITRSNLFVAAGDYPILTSSGGTTQAGALTYQNTDYATGTIVNTGTAVNLHVVRNGFDKQAIGTEAQRIGLLVENIGAGSPTAGQFTVLNALEQTTTPQQLTAALLGISPQPYTKIQAISELHHLVGLVEGRIASTRDVGVAAGDYYEPDTDQGVWARALNSSATQKLRKNILPYTAKNQGFAVGLDGDIKQGVTLGLGASISRTNITDSTTSTTITNVKNYQAMLYGSLKLKSDSYLDLVVASGVNNYKSSRNFLATLLATPITAEYSGLNFSAKLLYSKLFIIARYAQITPIASAQYTYLQQAPYQESGSAILDMKITTKNMNIFTLGLGAKLGLPVIHAGMNIVPSVYSMLYVDAKGGQQQTFSQFVSGGDALLSTAKQSILLLKVGVSLDFKFRDKLDLVLSYDLDTRHSFKGRHAFANLRYKF